MTPYIAPLAHKLSWYHAQYLWSVRFGAFVCDTWLVPPELLRRRHTALGERPARRGHLPDRAPSAIKTVQPEAASLSVAEDC